MGAFPWEEVAGLGAVVQGDPPPSSLRACLFLHHPCPVPLQRYHREELGGNSAERGLPAPFTEFLLEGRPEKSPKCSMLSRWRGSPHTAPGLWQELRGQGGVAEQWPRGRRQEWL